MLLLDTADVPPEERVAAFRAALRQASVHCRVERAGPAEDVRALMRVWPFGRVSLLAVDGAGLRLVRTPGHARQEGPDLVAVALQTHGHGRFSQFGRDQVLGARDVLLGDLTAPYEFSWVGSGACHAVHIPYEQLGLPVDVVRTAAPRLAASPLHALVRGHLGMLAERADAFFDDAGAASLGTATTELVRALVASAAGDEDLDAAVMDETLLTRVKTYVGLHLGDRRLTPEHLARAHHVSVRQLYQECAAAGLSLEQWVIDQRLEVARADLASPAGLHRSIAATARACGFADASHFTRRFREAFGMTPRDWRQHATPPAA